jgi:hypothetical protein
MKALIVLILYLAAVYGIGVAMGLHKTRRHDRDNMHK